MKKRWMGVLAIAVVPAAVSLGAGNYDIKLLPTPVGTSSVMVGNISRSGLVGGEAFIGDLNTYTGHFQPLIWQNGSFGFLPVPEGLSGDVGAVNDLGQVSGGVWPGGVIPQPGVPAAWSGGQLQILPTPAGTLGSTNGIAADGSVLGSIESQTELLANGIGHTAYAVVWSNGQATQVGDFPGMQASAIAKDSNGNILLRVSDNVTAKAYVWSNGNLTQIVPITGNSVAAYGMNDSGQVVGSARTSDGSSHAFSWQNNTLMDLGVATGQVSSLAVGINSAGLIVGYGYDSNNAVEGLLWRNGQLSKLSDLIPAAEGWSSLIPAGIADDGSIAGTGIYNGQTTAFLLTPSISPLASPAPEPATAAALLLAAPLLLRRRRRSVLTP